ncbi:hypothetical protein CFC21_012706 [Triticum aestivum]|uniref:DUF1618 domain-containing protein n=2 Tax=Triticum aestivum TaxID=4565 RepID=A0A3B5ZZ40_WHEAT|nr:uncharacterized protein LOC123182325 [Triticum aestivum]KAF6996361.1 hypothetical protein CFC21_012706 [Triticum aestivum]
MPPLLRGVVSGRLRRSLCTAAASIPPWAMVDRGTLMKKSEGSVSFSFARAPAVSYVTIPIFGRAFMSKPPPDGRVYSDMLRSRVLAASGHGFLLLGTLKSRYRAHPLSGLDLPAEVLLKVAPLELLYRKFTRFVCNPVSGQLFRLPEFEEAERTLSFTDGMAGMGLLTQADGDGPNRAPKRYAAAQLTEVDGGRRLLLRRFSSETGDWDEQVLPSPLPPQRRMHLGHEVLDFGGRLWWVDVSWGAVCVDPFSVRPELCPVELPPDSMLPNQQGETEMEQLVQRWHMGVSAGRLRYAEIDPLHIRSFVLDDDQSGRWTLEHQVSVPDLWRNGGNAKATPSIAAIDPLDNDALHLSVDKIHVSLDMLGRTITKSSVCTDESQMASGSYLPCVLPSFLWSSPIPGKNKTLDMAKNTTLADVLVRSDRQQTK